MQIIINKEQITTKLDAITEKGICKGVFFDWSGSLYCSYDTSDIFAQYKKLNDSGVPVFVMTMIIENEEYYKKRFQDNGIDIDNIFVIDKRLLRNRKIMAAVDDDDIALAKYRIDPSNVELCCIALNRIKTSYLKEKNINLDRKNNVITDKEIIQKKLDEIEINGLYPAIFFEGHGTIYKDDEVWEDLLWQIKEVEDHEMPVFITEKTNPLAPEQYEQYFENAGINMNNIYIVNKNMLKNKEVMISVESDYINSTIDYGISARKLINSSNKYWCISEIEDFTELYRQGIKEVKSSKIKPLKDCVEFDRVGAKVLTLANLSRFNKKNYIVPCGDVLTQHFFVETYKNVMPEIDFIVASLNKDMEAITKASIQIEKLIDSVDIRTEILDIDHFQKKAIRSSGNYEDGANASFAGVYESILNVSGQDEMINAIKTVMKSFYSPSALDYYLDIVNKEEYPDAIRPAVFIQNQVDAKYAGVAFLSSPTKGSDYIHINITEGLGDELLSGNKKGYEIYINKKTMAVEGDVEIAKNLPLESLKKTFELVKSFFKQTSLYKNPNIDIEFAIDNNNQIFLLQARPVSVGEKDIEVAKCKNLSILKSKCDNFICGKLHKVENKKDIKNIKEGNIVVVSDIEAEDLPYLKKASAVIVKSTRQALLSHASVLLREIVARNNIVAVVGSGCNTSSFKKGAKVSLNTMTGQIAFNNLTEKQKS